MRTLPPAVDSMLSWRSPPSLSLRMLWLPPLHSVNPNPRLHPASSVSPPSNRHPQSFFNPSRIPVSDSRGVPQSMALSRCFSGPTSPVSIPSSPESDNSDSQILVVVSFYKFADFADHASLRQPLKQLCEELRVSGGIILAREGINGSICGTRESVEKVLEFIQNDNCLEGLRRLESPVSPEEEAIHHGHTSSSPLAAGEDAPFRWDHVRVKLKKEIVSLGMPDASPIEKVGKYVSPRDWNALISDPDTVYHLEGGILKYLEEVPRTESLWEGECFVFDKRVSVEHGLAQGTHKLCYRCKQPVTDADMESPQWEYGVTCPYCFSSKSDDEKDRARARQRQFETWGIIGGPDKGRKPDSTKQSSTHLSNSV